MKLYVCWGTFPSPLRPGGHPCRNAHEALREAGYDPEVVKVRGLGIGPVKWMTSGRKEIQEMTGQPVVPVLVTDDGRTIHDSKRIIEWAQRNPAGAASATGG